MSDDQSAAGETIVALPLEILTAQVSRLADTGSVTTSGSASALEQAAA
ncbi:hypothetical protein [Agromyces sp. Marseille-Q5079]